MENGGGQNGGARVEHEKKPFARMELILDPLRFHLDMKVECPNYDCALAMLEQAKRAIEAEMRKANALQLQQQIAEQQQAAAIAKQIRGRA